jgi:23S rRNA (cytosine1962-C5)-methyltransferase
MLIPFDVMTHPHLDKRIILKKNEERRILAGHPWVFSNEIRETYGSPAAGDVVELMQASGATVGIGLYHPHSLIALRLLGETLEEIDQQFFFRRLARALKVRATLFPGATCYRLVHGEADFLPGLIVDRYNDYLAVQTLSLGMDLRLPMICEALEQLLHPAAIVERNESPLRLLEQLPQEKGILRGSVQPITIEEHGLRYTVDILEGQKTGFFLDQRENRAAAAHYCRSGAVLDCFCNDGGFALNAARGGASSVLALDASADAVARARANAALNGLTTIAFEQADVFERLDSLAAEGRRFDAVILDPPSFTRTKKNVQPAKQGYRDLHRKALALLQSGGILFTASCSHHIEPEVFLAIVDQTARKAGKRLQLLEWRGAAPDHPTLPAVPETKYLKVGVFTVE